MNNPPQYFLSRNRINWLITITSLLIIGGLAFFMLIFYYLPVQTPPVIEAVPRFDQLRKVQDRYYLPVAVTNRGDLIAQQLWVQVSLFSPEIAEETWEINIDFLEGHNTKEYIIMLRKPPEGRQFHFLASFRAR